MYGIYSHISSSEEIRPRQEVSVLCVFVVVLSMCLLYVRIGSRVILRIFGLMFMGSVVLFICSASYVLYSARSGVKSVHDVLSELILRLFVCVHVCISCRYY